MARPCKLLWGSKISACSEFGAFLFQSRSSYYKKGVLHPWIAWSLSRTSRSWSSRAIILRHWVPCMKLFPLKVKWSRVKSSQLIHFFLTFNFVAARASCSSNALWFILRLVMYGSGKSHFLYSTSIGQLVGQLVCLFLDFPWTFASVSEVEKKAPIRCWSQARNFLCVALPGWLEMNHSLCWLGLAKNRLRRINHLQNLSSLAVLDISDNNVTRLGSFTKTYPAYAWNMSGVFSRVFQLATNSLTPWQRAG